MLISSAGDAGLDRVASTVSGGVVDSVSYQPIVEMGTPDFGVLLHCPYMSANQPALIVHSITGAYLLFRFRPATMI